MHRFFIAAGLLAVAISMPVLTEAREPRWRANSGGNYVIAESRFGHGTVSGPVRMTREGRQVRLPGGTWIDCGRNCSETLRIESVDFWENQGGRNRTDNPCGLFGCLSRQFWF